MKTWPDSLAANSSRHRPSRASTSKTPSTTLSVRFVDTTKRCHRTRPDQARLAHAPQKARWTWASLAKTPAAAENASLCNWMWVLGFNNGRKAHKPGHEKRSLRINRNEPEKKEKRKKSWETWYQALCHRLRPEARVLSMRFSCEACYQIMSAPL